MTPPPPWDTDQAALNAAAVLDNPREHREDRSAAVWCDCPRPRRIIRVFAALVDDTEPRPVFLVPAYSLAGARVPALAAPAPRPGANWTPLYGHCARCRTGRVVFYPDDAGGLDRMRATGEPTHLVISFGIPGTQPAEPGDAYDYVAGSTWSRGPAGSWLLHVGPPTRGTIAP